MTPTVAELIGRARTLIESEAPLAERVQDIQRYSKDFDLWYAEFQNDRGNSQILDAKELLVLHNQLVAIAEQWLKQAGRELGNHRQKRKGIIAYADTLPKRISRYRVKKG